MQFRLRTLFIAMGLIAVTIALVVGWLKRPVTGRTHTGKVFQISGFSALTHCVMTNDADSLKRLLRFNDYDLDQIGSAGDWTLLQHAVHHGSVETTALLLEHGANPDMASEGTPTPLELAQREGNPDLVRVLVEHGATSPPLGN